MTGATPRQLQVLAFIRAQISSRGLPPTLREIAAHLGATSDNAARSHRDALDRKGLVEGEPMLARSLRVTEAGYRVLDARGEAAFSVDDNGRAAPCFPGARTGVALYRVLHAGSAP